MGPKIPDKLRDTLLHRLLGVLGDLGRRWKSPLHYAIHVGYRQETVLLAHVVAGDKV